jgi:hypothetical protein
MWRRTEGEPAAAAAAAAAVSACSNLSGQKLSGPLPASWAGMKQLTTLDLCECTVLWLVNPYCCASNGRLALDMWNHYSQVTCPSSWPLAVRV